jgi:hypothetical protein
MYFDIFYLLQARHKIAVMSSTHCISRSNFVADDGAWQISSSDNLIILKKLQK